MKTSEPRSTAAASKSNTGFFAKESRKDFFGVQAKEKPFFSAGNKSTGIQTKLNIGSPNDKYEKEADNVADKVVQRLSQNDVPQKTTQHNTASTHLGENSIQQKAITPVGPVSTMVQAKINAGDKEEKLQKKDKEDDKEATIQKKPIFESNAEPDESRKAIQRKADHESPQHAAPAVEDSLQSTKGTGNPLPASTRAQMENSLGADLSGVRIHNDSKAAQLSNDLNAQAFTHGNDIYFNEGKYNTSSTEGKHLLAHELTHTVQQGATVQRKENTSADTGILQKKGGAAGPAKPQSSQVVDISKGGFNPSEIVKKEIEEAAHKGGLDVRIKAGPFAEEGVIRVAKKGEGYDSKDPAYLVLTNAWLQTIPGLFLRVDVKNNVVTGLVTLKRGGQDLHSWLQTIKAAEEKIGFGFHFTDKISNKIAVTNKLEGGTLSLGFKDFAISIGGFMDMKLNMELANLNTPVFDGSATVKMKGAEGVVNVDNKNQGKLGGSGSLTITGFKGFSGLLEVKYDPVTGLVDIHGKAEYSGDKLSGSIDLVSTDLATANSFAKDAIKAAGGVENAQNAAPPAAVPAPKETGKRGIAGVGQLQFHLTEWFAGTVNVIVDAEGHITVIGKIAPPAEITLFKQKDWDNELFKFEAKAYYGLPVVGNLNLFANISLHSIAKLGPAKIYNIEILGTYSTDPEVQKSIQIAGSINISGYAGLRLRAEGGAGIEILSHDLKFGVGVQADVGVQAYADARPTIGWRDPGEFYISGTLDLVAQPVLGLGGDFFIELETPWWSPLSDHKWTWPLFAKQWPLTDPIGLSAELKNYVLGSGNVPDITFKKPEFDPSKFMTNMVDDNLPDKKGEGGTGAGSFKEDGSVTKPPLPDKKKPKADKAQAGKDKPKKEAPPAKSGKNKPEKKADPEAIKIFEAAGAKLKGVKEPITRTDLQKKLHEIEASTKGIKFTIQQEGTKWVVASTAKGMSNPHPVKFNAILTEADKKGEGKKDTIEAAVAEITTEGKEKIADGEVTRADADKIVADVKKDHPGVIQSINVLDGGADWKFEYVQAVKQVTVPKKQPGAEIKVDSFYKSKTGIFIKINAVAKDYIQATNIREGKAMKLQTDVFTKLVSEKNWELTTEAEVSKITPEKRFLPASWSPGSDSIRPKLYESHGWATKSDAKKKAELPGIKAEIQKVMNSNDPARDLQWNELIKQGKVESGASIANYDPDKVSYHVDHEPDLAISWNTGDNDKGDDIRKDHVLDDKHLRVVTSQFNLGKGRTKYALFVGKNFESAKLNVAKNAKSISGEAFLDAENGKPIL